jgi:activating signal cointegrator 1
MKAVSLWEPWASAMAWGLKGNETRHWYTAYRGPIAIHAAKTREHADFIHEREVREAFAGVGIRAVEDLPFGCVVCTGFLRDVVRVETIRGKISPLELALGNYDDGRFAWVIDSVKRLEKPEPAKGAQGFWEWTSLDEEARWIETRQPDYRQTRLL